MCLGFFVGSHSIYGMNQIHVKMDVWPVAVDLYEIAAIRPDMDGVLVTMRSGTHINLGGWSEADYLALVEAYVRLHKPTPEINEVEEE